MAKVSSNLFPMMVTPFNFTRGDVVKKIITDNIQTPYTGIITAIVPSTNKVEVQWPWGNMIEDPWDLIKVNPIINPPVVNEDKAYNTYQNELSHQYFEKIQPHQILKDYVDNDVMPLIMRSSSMYNKGVSKTSAFKTLVSEFDNKRLIINALNRVYSDELDLSVNKNIEINGENKKAALTLKGNDDIGFDLTSTLDNKKDELHFDNIQAAVNEFNRLKESFNTLSLESIVKKAQKFTATLNQNKIKKVLNLLTKEKLEPKLVTPAFVTDFAKKNKIDLKKDEVVYISNNF